MIYALLLIATIASGQESSTTTVIPLLDQIQISNLGKDTRSLLSGRYTQTGKPTFKNGVCFGDATCQTTAATTTGNLRQFVSSMTTGIHVIAGAIPEDTSIPQISEGDQVLVATMTPVNSNSRILIEGVLNINERVNSSAFAVVCIFRDATANAIACFQGLTMEATASAAEQVQFKYVVSAANTTERNYSIRVGGSGANVLSVNSGASGAARYGGTLTSSLFLTEIAP